MQQEAVRAFRKTYSEILYDIADDAADFDDFAEGVQAFGRDEGAEALDAWRAARDAFKTGELKLESLSVQKTRQKPSVTIVKLDTNCAEAPGRAVPSPEINNSEKLPAAV